MEAKHIRKKAKQNEMIKKMEKESNIKLLNYKKAKEIEKEEKLKEYELEKKKFEDEEEIEINNLKIKSEIADKIFVLLFFSKINIYKKYINNISFLKK